MGVADTLLLLVALLVLPCAVAGAICARDVVARFADARASRRAARRERRVLGGLARGLDGATPAQQEAIEALDHAGRPAIEQIAQDLRRLGRHRLGVATRSPVWHEAILRAYDDRLRLACHCLGVVEHLDGLGGMDLEIERVRVEGELLRVGLVLGGSRWGQAA